MAGVNKGLTYAPVCKMTTLHTTLAFAASDNLHMRQFHVKTVRLEEDLDQELYMEQSKGFEQGPLGTLCKLLKSMSCGC